MHTLHSKQALIQYVNAYAVPPALINIPHPAIYWKEEDKRWKWALQYLMGLSIKQLSELCEYLEKLNNVDNPRNK